MTLLKDRRAEFKTYYDKGDKLSKWEENQKEVEATHEETLNKCRAKMDALRTDEAAVPDEPTKEVGSDDETMAHGMLNTMLEDQHERDFHNSNRLQSTSEEEQAVAKKKDATPKKRAKQICRKCGQLRAGHTCPFKTQNTSSHVVSV